MGLKLIAAPVSEPVSLAEAKLHLRVESDFTDDDALISALVVSARQSAEHLTGRAIMPQTLELALDEFQDEISLPRPPIASITSVKYLDQDEALQTLGADAYLLDDHSEPSRIVPAYGTSWPATLDQSNAVLIRYVAGYADAAAVPQEIKSWMLLRIGMLYESRESAVQGAPIAELPYVDRLLDPYRIWRV